MLFFFCCVLLLESCTPFGTLAHYNDRKTFKWVFNTKLGKKHPHYEWIQTTKNNNKTANTDLLITTKSTMMKPKRSTINEQKKTMHTNFSFEHNKMIRFGSVWHARWSTVKFLAFLLCSCTTECIRIHIHETPQKLESSLKFTFIFISCLFSFWRKKFRHSWVTAKNYCSLISLHSCYFSNDFSWVWIQILSAYII